MEELQQDDINNELRNGILKELQRPDLSSEDRAQYQKALANLDKKAQNDS